MFDKLDFIEEKYRDLNEKVSQPDIIADTPLWTKYCKEVASLTPIVEKYRAYKQAKADMEEAKVLLEDKVDKELHEMAELELEDAKARTHTISEELKVLLLPKDPNDEKNVIIEIRAGAGGEEAALFAGSLFRMYSMYAEANRWKIELIDQNPTELGATKKLFFRYPGIWYIAS